MNSRWDDSTQVTLKSMTSILDQMLEPGEHVLKRARRLGLRSGWQYSSQIIFGGFAVLLGLLAGNFFQFWQLDIAYALAAFNLLLAGMLALGILERTCGRYAADAIVTTRRVLAGADGTNSTIDELNLDDLTGVEFFPAYFFDREQAVVSGNQDKVFHLTHPGGARGLAIAVATVANLPTPRQEGWLKKWLAKFSIWLWNMYLLLIAGMVFLVFPLALYSYL